MTAIWTKFLGVAMKSNGVKLGSLTAGGGGLIALLFGLHSDVTNKIEKQGEQNKIYTELKIEPIKVELQYLKAGQKEIKQLIRSLKSN